MINMKMFMKLINIKLLIFLKILQILRNQYKELLLNEVNTFKEKNNIHYRFSYEKK